MEMIRLFGIYLFYCYVSGSEAASGGLNQDEFLESLTDYEIVVPSRVTREGHHIEYNLHPDHSLRRRSTQLSDVQSDLHYSVTINRKNHILKLDLNKNLISPGLIVERRKNKFKNVTDSQFSYIGEQHKDCHFHGNIVNQTYSKVAIGLCNGMHGFIHTDQEEFFIEPLQNGETTFGGQRRHVIYKRSALPDELDPVKIHNKLDKREADDISCGVSDSHQAHTQRERWQKHHHVNKRNSKHHRSKRSFSTERYVETLVVVDPSMIKYHKNEHLETYVLTVMNMVAAMFYDASIGNSINIVLVRILLMEQEQEELVITHHADKTLKSFCKYQKMINFKDDSHPNHHDVAILLTRKNICSRLNEPCGTLGLAQVSGMCQPHRSCSINEDTGLALAYTVTHELGHNFGMHHDGASNGCEDPPGKQLHIMSPSLVADSLTKSWSNCSKQAITQFIDRDWGYCLDDEPSSPRYIYPVLPPGTMYDADHQCRLQYGSDDATICTNEQDVCANLWCRTENKCSTHLEAAAEGTICGENKWCFDGKCVKIGERPEAINGEWGEWTSWTECTRSCGGGVSNSQRHCDNPAPSHGGKYCLGERKRYRICNTEDCENSDVSFNQKQCGEFNYIPYKNRLYEWEHVPTSDTPCQLHCKPKNHFFSVLLKDIVTDGTPCTPGTRNMCLSGRCRLVGCDYVIDSKAREDRCGVCHGDGSTCTTIKSQFNESQGLGYVEATIIPKGARNIRVEEVAAASNFLALQDSDGKYILNGNWFIQWSGDYKAAGTTVQYTREGNKESVVSSGPLKEPLHVMLLLQSSNPGVLFEYTVPKDNVSEPRQPVFQWSNQPWTHCTASCGGGSQRSEVICTELEAGVVDDKYCNVSSKPDDIQRVCNEHLCPARWWTGPWQHCSVTCGTNGVHQRTVICVRSLGEDEQIALDDEACIADDKPPEMEPCRKKEPCPGNSTWIVGNWSSCNGNPCGLQYRRVECMDSSIGCENNEAPISEKACTDIPCGEWQTTKWTNCTRQCGDGIQYRKVICVGSEFCDTKTKPITQQSCNTFLCTHTPAKTTSNAPITTIPTIQSEVDPSIEDTRVDKEIVEVNTNKSVEKIPEDVYDVPKNESDSGPTAGTAEISEEQSNKMSHTKDQELNKKEQYDILNEHTEENGVDISDLAVVTVTDKPHHKHRHHHGDLHVDKQTKHQNQDTPVEDISDSKDINEEKNIRVSSEEIQDVKSQEADKDIGTTDKHDPPISTIKDKMTSEVVPFNVYPLPKQNLPELPELPNMGELPPLPDLNELPPLNKLSDLNDLPPLPDIGDTPALPNTHFSSILDVEDKLALPKANSDDNKDKKDRMTDTSDDEDHTKDAKEHIPHTSSIIPEEITSTKPVPKGYSTILPPADYTQKQEKEELYKTINVDNHDVTEMSKMSMSGSEPDMDMINNLTLHEKDPGLVVDSVFGLKTEDDGHNFKWKPLDWSDCSSNCGGGVRTRVLECLDMDTQSPVLQDLCDINTRPTATEGCNQYKCATWLTSSWGKCSSPCGHSVRQRLVTCQQNGMCDAKEEPTSEEICDVPKCVKWVSGQWSKCNKPCDGGEQLRLVQCIDIPTQLRTQGCDYSEKPDERQDCNIDPCTDNNAALSLRCEYNEISSRLCRALKKMGQCSNRFVALKCCKTCSAEGHKKANKNRPRTHALR